jgi:hypothetical protein
MEKNGNTPAAEAPCCSNEEFLALLSRIATLELKVAELYEKLARLL